VSTGVDAAHMRRALELALRGRLGTHPNPMVGAVLVRDGRVVGEGWHREYGGPHAEVEALVAAGEAARGATLYVTLEPCSHHGRTPPCTDALIAAGIARVVIAAEDPNPAARGGAVRLQAAGLEVVTGVERAAARSLNAAFFHVHERGTPFVALKLALSLDGLIAARPGERTSITGPEVQAETHALRAAHDAVMVGSVTARVDDPLLTVRRVTTPRQPIRIVIDSEAGLDPGSRLVATVADAPVWVVCAEDAPAAHRRRLEREGVRVLAVPRGSAGDSAARVDLDAAAAALREHGVRVILVEGGAGLAAGLLDAGLVQRLHLFVAPLFLGGPGIPAFAASRREEWRFVAVQRLGADVLLTLDPAHAPVER
jgi:diaminohydroxyphosphoribosylaminopyrimidine deaminase / 5-amino-6-(5-phosphoribosylamino)uracil reductase